MEEGEGNTKKASAQSDSESTEEEKEEEKKRRKKKKILFSDEKNERETLGQINSQKPCIMHQIRRTSAWKAFFT
jgi:hypothetical protein